jgi:acyl-coenzyme A synthetase/AMP-(fatty) acid ligase
VEVEGTLLRHPAVQEAAVVGMADAKWGEAPHAFIVLKPGAQGSADELRAFVRERLAHFKCPHSFNFVTDLPKTRNAKVMRRVIRATYLGEPAGDLSALENPQALEAIRRKSGPPAD